MPSLNAAGLRTTNFLERYPIIFKTGQVLKNCMDFLLHFLCILKFDCFCIDLLLKRIIHGYFILGRVIQGSGLSGPIPSGISLLTKLTDLYVCHFILMVEILL